MTNFEHVRKAMEGTTQDEDLILRPDRLDSRLTERLPTLTPASRLEALRKGGSSWEIEYWEGIEVEQTDRHRLGNVASRNLKANRIP